MTLALLCLLTLAIIWASFATVMYLVGLARNAELRQKLQEERMWADEFGRRMDEAEAEAAAVRREYAKVLLLHDGQIVQQISQAWQTIPWK